MRGPFRVKLGKYFRTSFCVVAIVHLFSVGLIADRDGGAKPGKPPTKRTSPKGVIAAHTCRDLLKQTQALKTHALSMYESSTPNEPSRDESAPGENEPLGFKARVSLKVRHLIATLPVVGKANLKGFVSPPELKKSPPPKLRTLREIDQEYLLTAFRNEESYSGDFTVRSTPFGVLPVNPLERSKPFEETSRGNQGFTGELADKLDARSKKPKEEAAEIRDNLAALRKSMGQDFLPISQSMVVDVMEAVMANTAMPEDAEYMVQPLIDFLDNVGYTFLAVLNESLKVNRHQADLLALHEELTFRRAINFKTKEGIALRDDLNITCRRPGTHPLLASTHSALQLLAKDPEDMWPWELKELRKYVTAEWVDPKNRTEIDKIRHRLAGIRKRTQESEAELEKLRCDFGQRYFAYLFLKQRIEQNTRPDGSPVIEFGDIAAMVISQSLDDFRALRSFLLEILDFGDGAFTYDNPFTNAQVELPLSAKEAAEKMGADSIDAVLSSLLMDPMRMRGEFSRCITAYLKREHKTETARQSTLDKMRATVSRGEKLSAAEQFAFDNLAKSGLFNLSEGMFGRLREIVIKTDEKKKAALPEAMKDPQGNVIQIEEEIPLTLATYSLTNINDTGLADYSDVRRWLTIVVADHKIGLPAPPIPVPEFSNLVPPPKPDAEQAEAIPVAEPKAMPAPVPFNLLDWVGKLPEDAPSIFLTKELEELGRQTDLFYLRARAVMTENIDAITGRPNIPRPIRIKLVDQQNEIFERLFNVFGKLEEAIIDSSTPRPNQPMAEEIAKRIFLRHLRGIPRLERLVRNTPYKNLNFLRAELLLSDIRKWTGSPMPVISAEVQNANSSNAQKDVELAKARKANKRYLIGAIVASALWFGSSHLGQTYVLSPLYRTVAAAVNLVRHYKQLPSTIPSPQAASSSGTSP
jgi:hypothetical protein